MPAPALSGPQYLREGLKLVLSPGLRLFVLLPLAINLVLFVGLIYFAGHHRPEQAGQHPAEHACNEDDGVAVRQGRDDIDHHEAEGKGDQQGAARDGASHGDERDGRQRGGQGVDADQLADLGFRDAERAAHLGQ